MAAADQLTLGHYMDAPYQTHSDTSRAAGNAMLDAPERLTGLRAAVYRVILERGGATDAEVQDALSLPVSTQVPRRVELVARGLVRDSGERRRCKAVVWEVIK